MIAMARLCSSFCVSETQFLRPLYAFLYGEFWETKSIAMTTPPIFPFLYLPCPKTRGTILSAPKRQIGSGSTFTKASSSERASYLQKLRCSTFTSKTSQKGGLWYLTPPQTLSNPICKNGIYNRVFFCRAPSIYIVVVPKIHRLSGFCNIFFLWNMKYSFWPWHSIVTYSSDE